MNRLGVFVCLGFVCGLFSSYLGLENSLFAKSISTSEHLMDDLRSGGKRLELSSSYQPHLRIDTPLLSQPIRLGNCDFYPEFLKLLGVERANAVEVKIRRMNIDEANNFIRRYGERLRDQNKWTVEIGEKLDFFATQISEPKATQAHCHLESQP